MVCLVVFFKSDLSTLHAVLNNMMIIHCNSLKPLSAPCRMDCVYSRNSYTQDAHDQSQQ